MLKIMLPFLGRKAGARSPRLTAANSHSSSATAPAPMETSGEGGPMPPAAPGPVLVPPGCTLFHVTHWKAASQWIRAIISDLFGPALVPAEYFQKQLLDRPIDPGKVYACVYLTKHEYDALEAAGERRQFVLIRDLRDTLVSAYFSARYSHEIKTGLMAKWRWVLNRLPQEEGMMYLLETWLAWSALIQRTWLEAGRRCYKLEDCMRDETGMVDRILRESWGLTVDSGFLRETVEKRSFKALSGGRPPGEEDVQSHYRKGVAGDWRQHFTPRLTRRFKERYNDVLILAGYEQDSAW